MALTNLQGSDPLLRYLKKQQVISGNTDASPWYLPGSEAVIGITVLFSFSLSLPHPSYKAKLIVQKASLFNHSSTFQIIIPWSAVLNHSVVANSLPPHGLHHARFPHPSLSPESCSNLNTKEDCCVEMKTESKAVYTSIKRKKDENKD